jgi:Fic family protein
MILGHKRAFDYIWTHQQAFRRLTRQHLEQIHELLTEGLDVPRGIRTSGVGITGTAYVPPASKIEIVSYLDSVLRIINALDQPAEKAIACLVLVPYLQPFVDGNKGTSRLLANQRRAPGPRLSAPVVPLRRRAGLQERPHPVL